MRGGAHGAHAARFSFPKDVCDEPIEQERIVPHPVFPAARGPAARRTESQPTCAP